MPSKDGPILDDATTRKKLTCPRCGPVLRRGGRETLVCTFCKRTFRHGLSTFSPPKDGELEHPHCAVCDRPVCARPECCFSWWTITDERIKICRECLEQYGLPREPLDDDRIEAR